MKKLITICLLVVATFSLKAQEMNFDETVKYINEKIACCSELKESTITATLSGDLSWQQVGGNKPGSHHINLFDLVPSKVEGGKTILNSYGIHLWQTSINCISFQFSDTSMEYLNDFKSQVDAERVFKALLHLRGLCIKKKDPFDN